MKRTNKALVLELLEKDLLNNGDGLSTIDISKALTMQRTNVSRILNELVEEGYAIKSENKRPVVYMRSDYEFDNKEQAVFKGIGHNGSLKHAIHLAKAAIMYPNKSLPTLLVAPVGSGKSAMAKNMYTYAIIKNVLPASAPYVSFDCLNYKDNIVRMNQLFKECLNKAENGFLYVDNWHLLDNESKSIIADILDDGYYEEDGKRKNANTILVCSINDSINVDDFTNSIRRKFSIVIDIPSLEERGLDERFQLIKMYFYDEAEKSNCTFSITSESIICLLLYNCNNNTKQLKNDIRQACASAYVRSLDSDSDVVEILIMDFPYYVRSGLLNYKNRYSEIEKIITEESKYIFDSKDYSVKNRQKVSSGPSIYSWIDEKTSELHQRGFSEEEINTIVNVGIENEFSRYHSKLVSSIVNKDQLIQLVDQKIIDLVDNFLQDASKSLNRIYEANTFYGLCLHIQSVIDSTQNSSRITIDKIMEIVESNKIEYALATEFSNKLQEECNVSLSIDEVVVIAMFLCEKVANNVNQPAILLAMHGNGVAKTMAETVKTLTDIPIYSYDLPFSKKTFEVYDDIKKLILKIPNNNGILAICDVGSLVDIFNMLEMELGIKIKTIALPFTIMLLDFCRKVMLSDDINEAYDLIIGSYDDKLLIERKGLRSTRNKVIVSFCLTGEGGAIQIKNYLEKNFDLNGIEVIPLQLSKQNDFLFKLNKISKEKEILCITGTFNPDIYGIPFIPIENVFTSNNYDLNSLIDNEDLQKQKFLSNSNVVFEHLSLELTNVDGERLKCQLVEFILNVEKKYGKLIEMNEKIGLLVHLACSIDRTKAGTPTPKNPFVSEIIRKNKKLYHILKEQIAVIEQENDLKLNDDEFSNIICIIKKSKNG